MDNRPTKEITTPIGNHKVVIKSFVTGREKRSFIAVFLGDGKLSVNPSNMEAQNVDVKPNLIQQADELVLKTVVVSVDGSSEDVVNRVLDMHGADYDFVKAAVDEVAKDSEFSKKKQS